MGILEKSIVYDSISIQDAPIYLFQIKMATLPDRLIPLLLLAWADSHSQTL